MPKKPESESVEKTEPGERGVEAVERALSILEAFAGGASRLSLSEITEHTGFYRSTVLRLAVSLEKFGYLHRSADRSFRLGPSLARLAAHYHAAFDLADHVRPILKQVSEAVGETAAFYVREGDKRVCLYRHNAVRVVRLQLEEGHVMSLQRGAGARVLMAFSGGRGKVYDEIRKRGWFVSLGDRDPETGGVAVPVFGAEGKLVGSMGVTGPLHRFDRKSQSLMKDVLMAKARQLSEALGGPAGPAS
jgi:DNA-binding IclR family transcriptional regulator